MSKSKEEIIIDYNIEVADLRKAMKAAQSLYKATELLINKVEILATISGKSFGTVLAQMRKVDAEFAKIESMTSARGRPPKNQPLFMRGQPMTGAYDLAGKATREQLAINQVVNAIGQGTIGEPLAKQVDVVKAKISDLAVAMKTTEEQIVKGFLKATPPTTEWTKVVRLAGKTLDEDFKRKLDPLNMSLDKFRGQLTALASIPMDKPGAAFPQIKALPDIIRQISADSGRSFDDVGKSLVRNFGFSEYVVRNSIRNINLELEGVGGVLHRIFGGPNLVAQFFETAFGTFTAVLIFHLQDLLVRLFTDALQMAKNFEREMRELKLAESVLSQAGVEITLRDFEKMIDRFDERFRIFAKTDLRDMVSQVTTLTQEFGLSVEQIEKLTQSIIIAKIRFPNLPVNQIAKDIVTGLIQGRSTAIRKFTPFGEEIVSSKAVAMGLVEQNQELNEKQKLLAGIEVLWDSLGSKSATYIDNLEGTNELVDMLLDKEWKTLQEEVGGVLREAEIFMKELVLNTKFLYEVFSDQQEKANAQVKEFFSIWELVKIALASVVAFIGNILVGLSSIVGFTAVIFSPDFLKLTPQQRDEIIQSLKEDFAHIAKKVRDETVGFFFQNPQTMLGDWFKNTFGGDSGKPEEEPDTPTGTPPPVIPPGTGTDGEKEVDKISRALNSLMEQLDEVGDKARKMRDDFNLDTTRLDFDFLLDATRAWEDYNAKVADIWKDYNDSAAEGSRDYRNNELKEEAKFLEDLRQLREKFLFDLEDALRERDARQVLRLQRQYQMDKTNLTNEFELGRKERAAQHAQELSDAAKRRNDRLAELKREFDLARQREREDFDNKMARRAEDHAIEMQRLAEETEDKLRKAASAIAEENNMSISAAQQLYTSLSAYYGVGGSINKLFDYTYANMAGKAAGAYKMIMDYIQLYSVAMSAFSGGLGTQGSGTGAARRVIGGGGGSNIRGPSMRAKGGVDVASTPTRVTFGEQGPELAMFIPLGQMEGMFGANLRGMGGGDGNTSGGKIELSVTLSPDLEARIVQKSLNGVAASLNAAKRMRT